ncbi:MAG: hypothetical protein ACJA2G_000948 [Cognaticolwellia sp.]|jgi:hypothetical protein
MILNITAETRSLFVNPLRAILLRGSFTGKWYGHNDLRFGEQTFVLQQ